MKGVITKLEGEGEIHVYGQTREEEENAFPQANPLDLSDMFVCIMQSLMYVL